MSAHYSLGIDAKFDLTNAQLFSETQGRYIVAVKKGQSIDIEDATLIGSFTDTDDFKVEGKESVIERRTSELKRNWEGAIEACMTSVD